MIYLVQVGSPGATLLGWFDTNATVKITSKKALKFVSTCLRTSHSKKYPKTDALLGLVPEFERSDRAEILRVGRYKNFVANERLDILKHVPAGRCTPHPKLIQILVLIRPRSGISEIASDSSIGTQ